METEEIGNMELEEGVINADSDDETSIAKPLTSNVFLKYAAVDNMTLKEQASQLVVNVQEYFKKESQKQGPLIPPEMVIERASAALKIDPHVLVQVISRTSHQTRLRNENRHNAMHPLRMDAIKNFIEMYYRSDPNASLVRAFEKLVKSGLFKGSPVTLRRMLNRQGFDFFRGKRRCDMFKKIKPDFIFEDYYNKRAPENKNQNGLVDSKELIPPDLVEISKEDLGFFRSILPQMARLTEKNRFAFRMAVMNKVQAILYESTPSVVTRRTTKSPSKDSISQNDENANRSKTVETQTAIEDYCRTAGPSSAAEQPDQSSQHVTLPEEAIKPEVQNGYHEESPAAQDDLDTCGFLMVGTTWSEPASSSKTISEEATTDQSDNDFQTTEEKAEILELKRSHAAARRARNKVRKFRKSSDKDMC